MPDYRRVARQKAEKYGLDPNVFERQINAESNFRTDLTSSAGATGIAQFMPATASGLGINPNNPTEALDAAAKLMSGYVKKYGSYEKALRAYNAGPAAIERSRGFGETNAYVKKILTSGEPGALGKPKATSSKKKPSAGVLAPLVPETRTVTETATEFDEKGYERVRRQAALRSVLDQTGGMKMLRGLLPETADPAAFTREVETTTTEPVEQPDTPPSKEPSPRRTGGTGGGSAGIPGLQGKGSGIKELFYDPQGGWKGKQSIGAIGNHSDHVHVAAGKKTVIGLGKLAEEYGLTVRENPHWDKVDPVHVAGSNHYKNQAIDVSGDASKMAAYTKRLRRIYGLS